MHVSFPTLNPRRKYDIRDPETRGRALDCPGALFLPSQPTARRPAVVVALGLSGPKRDRELRYAEKLAQRGYVALVPNSYAARGADRHSDPVRALWITPSMMLADAFSALRFLSRRPEVDRGNISILGFSYGGMISVLAAYEQVRKRFCRERDLRFASHVSYYGCSIPRFDDPTTTGAPVLMLVGELDKNVSIERSRHIADDLRRGGSDVRFALFEGSHHQWDRVHAGPEPVFYALADCHIRIACDGSARDERTGLPITGTPSYLLFLTRNARLRGYTMLRDEQAARRSDEMLLAFLARAEQSAAMCKSNVR
jgi:dienelactone hydrolase